MAALQVKRAYEDMDEQNWQRPTRPQLVLCDVTEDRRSGRHSRERQGNRVLFLMAVLAVTLFIFGVTAQGLRQTAVADVTPQTLTVHVAKGDTLWRYAARYGDPNQYILARVDTLARANHLSSDAVLRPGQTLRIPVQNPAALAALPHRHASRV